MANRTGYVYQDKSTGKWTARVTFTDSRGKKRNVRRVAENKTAAKALLRELLSKLEGKGESSIDAEKITFRELAEKYKAFKVKPAEYVGDRKTGGLRSVLSVEYRIAALLDYFGKMRLRSITPGEIENFKSERLATKTKNGEARSIAAVNRELEILRAMLRFAKGEGWLDRSPFENVSTPLISKADETKRDRILSRDEEERLLLACAEGTPREHLRPLILSALDTGCRKGELLSLTWNDVHFDSRVIIVRALTTKTLTARVVPMSERLFLELQRLSTAFSDRERVFGISVKFQHGWETACRIAEIDDLHFHDLRATFCTRLIEAGMQIEQVAKLSGHTQLSTLYAHYLSSTAETISRAASILNAMNGSTLSGNERNEQGTSLADSTTDAAADRAPCG
jgi:integrase